jgi:hypothetical protein
MRAHHLAGLALAALAAPTLSAPLRAQSDAGTRRFIVSIDGQSRPIALDTMGVRVDLKGQSPLAVWNALTTVYDEAKLVTNLRDSTGMAMGNLALVARRSLWKRPLSRYFDCGAGMTGPNADSYRVTVALVSWVVPTADGSTVWTAIAAGGRDISGTSNPSTACQSLGELEGTIHDALRQRLGVKVAQR